MPVRKNGFDLHSGLVEASKESFASFLTQSEISKLSVTIENGQLLVNGPDKIVAKVSKNLS